MQRPAIAARAPLTRAARPSKAAHEPLHVLVMHQHYWPEIAATAQILADLSEDLAARGHRVSVICGQPSYRTADGGRSLPGRERRHGVEIQRVWSYVPSERSIPKRLVHYGTYFASSLAATLLRERPDVCLVMSTPPLLLGVSGTLVRALRGVPFVYSVQDLYPDVAVHLGVIRHQGLPAQAIERVAQQCYRSASALVTLSAGMAERLSRKGVPQERIHVVPNWADTASVTPAPRDNSFAREHGLCDRFVVQYSGNLGLSQGLDNLIMAAEQLRDLPITIALVGDGNARARLESLVAEKRLPNVRFFPPQPRERLSELLSSCEVGLVTMKRAVGNDLVPSKLYGIMAAARPVLASVPEGSEVARVVTDHGCGWVVAPESHDALAAGIRACFAAAPEERSQLGAAGRQACVGLYTREVLTGRYEEILLKVAGRTQAISGQSPAIEAAWAEE